jgi:ATP-dependent RNA helicase MRH4, mitochondrial
MERKGDVRGKAHQTPVFKRDSPWSSQRPSNLSKEVVTSTTTTKAVNPLTEEFDLSASKTHSSGSLPTSFSSPPLLDGLRDSVYQVLGPSASPTPIQALSLKHLFCDTPEWRQYLLASETGSGKSIAYLLPMLHHLKKSELASSEPIPPTIPSQPKRAMNPRALVLAPTHELSRQLSSFAKALLHNTKLKVLSASRANTKSTPRGTFTASKMSAQFADDNPMTSDMSHLGAFRPVDVLVGTPNKLLEMARGRGRNRNQDEIDNEPFELPNETSSKSPNLEMGLENVEWVVVDEADILFGTVLIPIRTMDGTNSTYSDPDFQESTRTLLADVAAARGQPVQSAPDLLPPSLENADASTLPQVTPINYPFNLILTSATIPPSLATYLDAYHPTLTRLASHRLHRLPSTMKTEYESWTGGNKDADIERRIRKVWAEDSVNPDSHGRRSKILIFCNKGTRVQSLGAYLEEKGVRNVALTKDGGARNFGNNHHLDGFLRTTGSKPKREPSSSPIKDKEVHVMITTSMLSRGLDFSPEVRHVFIVDEPRNMVDFLHRAGRSARAGQSGKVVVFGKLKGRGSAKATEMKKKVGALRS